jgi:hypothetical protein
VEYTLDHCPVFWDHLTTNKTATGNRRARNT